MNSLDYPLFQRLNSFSGTSVVFDALIIFGGKYLIFVLVGGALMIVWRIRRDEHFLRVVHILVSILLGEALAYGARLIYNRPRPFEMLDLQNQLLYHSAGGALPSGHVTAAFAIATVVFLWDRKWGAVFYSAALFVGISRIIGGVHWPTDILAGVLVGAWSAMIMYAMIWQKWREI